MAAATASTVSDQASDVDPRPVAARHQSVRYVTQTRPTMTPAAAAARRARRETSPVGVRRTARDPSHTATAAMSVNARAKNTAR
jgi:hypothetical protein